MIVPVREEFLFELHDYLVLLYQLHELLLLYLDFPCYFRPSHRWHCQLFALKLFCCFQSKFQKMLQGDTLALCLFIITVDYAMWLATQDEQSVGFTFAKARSKHHPARVICDTDYADDIALFKNTFYFLYYHTLYNL